MKRTITHTIVLIGCMATAMLAQQKAIPAPPSPLKPPSPNTIYVPPPPPSPTPKRSLAEGIPVGDVTVKPNPIEKKVEVRIPFNLK